MSTGPASLLIANATLIDGVTESPLPERSIWIDGARIKAIGRRDELNLPGGVEEIDARGKYVIPGLMNANVHLLADVRLENLVRYMGRYDELIVEATQVALRNGLTTVFDTWGPRRFLMLARDRIDRGEQPGSRIFCAGNIVGMDGPFSLDFIPKTQELASSALIRRIEAIWIENVGRRLMWLAPEQVASEVRTYIAKGIDFIKYASNDHVPGAFLVFSPRTQAAIVEETHRAGLTAQAHTMSVEGLWTAIQAGCDLIQHANITGPIPIPETTLELFAARKSAAVIFAFTNEVHEWIEKNRSEMERSIWKASDLNARRLIQTGAALLLANDGAVFPPDALTDPSFYGQFWARLSADEAGAPYSLAQGHFTWFKAMEEKGCPAMEMLRAATRNIAVAYGKSRDLGTVEVGKLADLLILDRNPLESAANYRSIHRIIKNGVVVDRDALPTNPILTRPMEPALEEEASYAPFFSAGQFPICPMCMHR